MKNWLNKKYTVEKSNIQLIIETLLESIIYSILLYYFIGDYSKDLADALISVSNNHLELPFVKILFPIILIIVAISKVLIFVNGVDTTKTVSKTKSKGKLKK